MESFSASYFISGGMDFMGILFAVVLIVAALVALGFFSGSDDRSYEEYRRAEYRNEYLWESRQRQQQGDNYFLTVAQMRRP